MIRSQHELNVTRKRLDEFEAALKEFDPDRPPLGVQPEGHHAAYDALVGFRAELQGEIEQYERLLTYGMAAVRIGTLAKVPEVLIQARIAQRLSQRGLAARLGVKPQQVQRWESEYYENASFASILDVANALELTDGFRAAAAAEAQNAIVATEPGVSWWQLSATPGIALAINPVTTYLIDGLLTHFTSLPLNSRNNYVTGTDQCEASYRYFGQRITARGVPGLRIVGEMSNPAASSVGNFAAPSHAATPARSSAELAAQIAELNAELARTKAELERRRSVPVPLVPQEQGPWLARLCASGSQELQTLPAFGECMQ